MADPKTIKEAFERSAKAVELKPSLGKSTGKSIVCIRNGTTCEIEGSGWKLTADVGKESGGNNEGPGPGVLERGALGSCLAIGYATWAAVLEVPVDSIEVEIETQFDARGMLAVAERPPGFTSIKYNVHIESPAPETKVQEVVENAENYSPVLDDFRRPMPVKREVTIKKTSKHEKHSTTQ